MPWRPARMAICTWSIATTWVSSICSTNNTVQTITINGSGAVNQNFSTPAYFNNNVYVCPSSETLKAFAISNALLATSATMQYHNSHRHLGFHDFGEWHEQRNCLGDSADEWTRGFVCIQCRESLSLLYASNQASGNRDQTAQILGNFHTPTVANGKVYFGTGTTVAVFGLLP